VTNPVLVETGDSSDPVVHLSDIFKHISYYRRRGHQIGRKVGDMLEILTLAAICRNDELERRLVVEPKLEGFSGAHHKVEFAIYGLGHNGRTVQDIPHLLSFIECKKVGVEQTVNTTFKKLYTRGNNIVPFDEEIKINFNPRWVERPTRFSVTFARTSSGARLVVAREGTTIDQARIDDGHRVMFGLTVTGEPFYVENHSSLRAVAESIRLCKILEIISVSDRGVTAILNDCLPGPQTPEKAKQASFVALDIRRERFGHFDKRPHERECVSVLVLTEFSHWESKSQNMVRASLDHNLVVDDQLVIDAIDGYENAYGLDFLDRMTKEAFLSSAGARRIANAIVDRYGGRMFRDISDNVYKRLDFEGRSVVVVP
jgi:hypothetical protein